MNETLALFPPRVTDHMRAALDAPYTKDEVRRAIFQMHPYKSLGPDGMSPLFFQKYWDILGDDLSEIIIRALPNGQVDECMNKKP